MERLSAHPAVGGYGELLLAGRDGWPDWPPGAGDRPFFTTYLKDRGIAASRMRSHLFLLRYLDYVYEPRRGWQAIGFKLMYDEVFPLPEVVAYLRVRNVRVLHLVRTNLLDIALSNMVIRQRSSPLAWSPDEREMIPVHVDTDRLIPWLVWLDRQRRTARTVLRTMRFNAHEVSYEELRVGDQPLDTALRFIGVADPSEISTQSTMVKLAPDSHREGIANFDAVAARLAGTRFQRFLRGEAERRSLPSGSDSLGWRR